MFNKILRFGIVCSIFSLLPLVVNGEYEVAWTRIWNNGSNDQATGVAVDGSGNIIVTGISNIGGNYDYLTIKYSPSGDTLWADTIDNGGDDRAYGVAVDYNGNIIVTGYSDADGDEDYFTVKYNPSGKIIWADTLNNGYQDYGFGVAVDGSGNIIVIGASSNGGNYDYFTVKYDPSGDTLWTRRWNNGSSDWGQAVTTDNSDNIIITGRSNITTFDMFTVKYNSSGDTLWVDTIDIDGLDNYSEGVTTDVLENVIITGHTQITSNPNYYTVKYDASGNVLWTREWDNGGYDQSYGITTDNSGNIFITGLGAIPSKANNNFFTVKYGPAGDTLWADTLDNGATEWAKGIAIDGEGNIIVTGHTGNMAGNDFFTVKYTDPAAAVELTNFEAIGKEASVEIQWMTEVEVDNYKWLLSRSREKTNGYKKIAELDAKTNGPNFYTYTDTSVVPEISYWYKLGDLDTDGKLTWHGPVNAKPRPATPFLLSLALPYPNPCKAQAKIEYQVPGYPGSKAVKVTLKIYNIAGQLVKTLVNELKKPGHYTHRWEGKDNSGQIVAPGLYFYRLEANSMLTGKLIRL